MGQTLTKKSVYSDAFEKAMNLWEMYARQYHNLIPEYEQLLARKKELRMSLYAVDKEEINRLENIHFLHIEDKLTAEEYLMDLNPKQINSLCDKIELCVKSPIYMTLKNKIVDYRNAIVKKEQPSKRRGYYGSIPTPPKK